MILEPIESADSESLRLWQAAQLRRQQARLCKRPVYRDIFQQPRIWTDVEQPDLIDSAVYRDCDLESMRHAASRLAYIDMTSGTTGQPKLRPVSDEDDRIDIRMLARSLCAAGVRDGDQILCIDAGDLNLFAIVSKALEHLGNAKAVFYAARIPFAQAFAEALQCIDPDFIFTIPSILMRGFPALTDYLSTRRPLRGILYTGESLDDRMRARLRKSYNVEAFSLYSSIELGFVGSECTEHDGVHLWTDSTLIHLADVVTVDEKRFRNHSLVRRGRLGASQLLHHAKPVFAYDTGDIVDYTEGPCPCGRTSPRMRFVARDSHTFSVYGTKMSVAQIRQIIYPDERDIASLMQVILTEDDRGVTLTLVLPVESFEGSEEEREEAIRARLESDASFAFLIELGLLHVRFSWRPAESFASRKVKLIEDQRSLHT